MTAIGWRHDIRELLLGGTSGARPYVLALTLATMIGTAIAYALPLSQRVDNVVSDGSFVVLSAIVVTVAAVRARWTRGLARFGWAVLATTFALVTVMLVLDPNPQSGDLPLFLDLAVLPAIGFWIAVLAFAAPALPGIASVRTAADALWVGAATVIGVWPWTIGPLLEFEGRSSLAEASHVAFAVSSITLASTVLVIIPFTAGRGRIALWSFGIGGATASLAGVFHIRYFYEETLRFGSAWDYLWTVGIGLLALAGLLAVDDELRPRARNARWYIGMTVLPLMFAAVGLVANGSGPAQLTGAVVLLGALSLRVIVLLIENERLTRSLTTEARHDPLTGLANRRTLAAGFARIGEIARAKGRLRALVVLDLDRFKLINDTHGHLVGDEVLKIVARNLRDAVRDEDVLIRQGGDEFVAVIVVRNRQEAERATERLRSAVKGRYSLPVGRLTVGATSGAALDDGTATLGDALPLADRALYRAKAVGRGSSEIAHVEDASFTDDTRLAEVHELPRR